MKRALVTGGTKGIGLAISKMLLHEGYFVTATYANDVASAEVCAQTLRDISTNFEIIKADQSNKDEIKILVKHLLERREINCIICNAGITQRKSMLDITEEEWEEVMTVNVNVPFFIIRDLYNIIPNGSRIIFIGSEMAIHPHGTSLAYGVSKTAVHALATNLVKFFEDTGTTVNAVAPGFVETEWQSTKPEHIRQNICNKTAVKRFASVEEIADAVRFCINNAFVNGSIIEVSGGYCYK
jgi:3-oxoacyl-[acyl-carrier protein] reductase